MGFETFGLVGFGRCECLTFRLWDFNAVSILLTSGRLEFWTFGKLALCDVWTCGFLDLAFFDNCSTIVRQLLMFGLRTPKALFDNEIAKSNF